MLVLKEAHRQLFRRTPDECFASLTDLHAHCQRQKEASAERWESPARIATTPRDATSLLLNVGTDGAFMMTDWAFTQLCKIANVGKETVNRLSADTASKVFAETLPKGSKPLQIFELDGAVRSIHSASYTRLHSADLLATVREFAVDFEPPQKAMTGSTGLFAGEQDAFCFLIDPTGWAEIEDQAFAPGFYLWNSEVGRRSVGIATFWFQAICQNHIVWDAVEVVDYRRKHTANVHESLTSVRRIIENLVAKRDERRDGFVRVLKNAMQTMLGDDADDVLKELTKRGIPRDLGKRSLEIAEQHGRFTIFAVVDALTRLTQELKYAGDRTEADLKAAKLLELAA